MISTIRNTLYKSPLIRNETNNIPFQITSLISTCLWDYWFPQLRNTNISNGQLTPQTKVEANKRLWAKIIMTFNAHEPLKLIGTSFLMTQNGLLNLNVAWWARKISDYVARSSEIIYYWQMKDNQMTNTKQVIVCPLIANTNNLQEHNAVHVWQIKGRTMFYKHKQSRYRYYATSLLSLLLSRMWTLHSKKYILQ